MKTLLEKIRKWMKNREEEERTVIGGDFNERTGVEEGRSRRKEEKDKQRGGVRQSKDRKVNKEVRAKEVGAIYGGDRVKNFKCWDRRR